MPTTATRRVPATAGVPLVAAALAAMLVLLVHLAWVADSRAGHRAPPPATVIPQAASAAAPDAARPVPSGTPGSRLAGGVARSGALSGAEPALPWAPASGWMSPGRSPLGLALSDAKAAPPPAAPGLGSTLPGVPGFGSAPPVARLSGAPVKVVIPAIGVHAALEKLRIGADGELSAPVDFDRAGWYAGGTAPGDLGPAVIAGHVDGDRGPAVFARLSELVAGDTIDVIRGVRTVRFTVTTASRHPKDDFPTARVYGPTPDPQLRLITCGGAFDRSTRSYRDNLVVYAVRA